MSDSQLKILVTNDDGIEAPGLKALASAFSEYAHITVVAPNGPRSECSHQIESRETIRVDRVDEHQYAVGGSPADCVRVALFGLYNEPTKFDWVVSGINHGGNLGIDRYISGTVAAAREATIHGIPSIAFSHYLKRGLEVDWNVACSWVPHVWKSLTPLKRQSASFYNVNFPHLSDLRSVPPIVMCPSDNVSLDMKYEAVEGKGYQYRGSYPDRMKTPDHDTDYCFRGHITCSLIHL